MYKYANTAWYAILMCMHVHVHLFLCYDSCSAGVADGLVRNFHIASVNRTHVTFSWDLESAYHSYVSQYRIYYRASYPGASSYGYTTAYSFGTAVQIGGGETFTYTLPITSFGSYSQYIMWLQVHTTSTPTYLYTEQIYTELGEFPIIQNYGQYF